MVKRKPHQLQKLTLLECPLLDTLNTSDTALVSLASLDIRQRVFGSSVSRKIHELCPNIVQLRITALLVDDAAVAKLIVHMKQNTLNKLRINGTLKSISLITHSLVQHHLESFEGFSIDMNPGDIQEDVVDPSVNSGILLLSRLPNLKSLTLKGMYVNTEMVTDIGQQCTKLSSIHLSGPYVATGAAEILITKLGKRLTELTLNIEERCLGRVLLLLSKHCPNLQKLDIGGMEFDCAQIIKLAMTCPQLSHVVLGHPLYAPTMAYNEMVRSLTANCSRLEYLNLYRVYLGPQIVRHLLGHSSLKKVILPIPLLHSPAFNQEVIQCKTALLGEQGVFELAGTGARVITISSGLIGTACR
ncbi:hypothetical protein K493DRAFT_405111 [Basidiobolus meristosporus CBS 931.73]|uniref:RNI-like protein n=1 Tax=Basidiobolus meristosporus CBS 931.73 TaxID=1314790 RepID=A0A1Y1YYR1_9FUNG|nr:hypothetical protein K493DRAFT_405111 [Basidiobolus meristosporus CBS 931.73]|eukprot:ORY03004.1 hypothetical protein K493DRAFT_405111 [Basidiobolus meristosporus CBS 931.73]